MWLIPAGRFDDSLAIQARCFPDNLIEQVHIDELWFRLSGSATPVTAL